MAFVFDGPNRIIALSLGTTSFDVADIYSRWKEWVAESDNAKYLPAFAGSVGGEPLGGGQFVGGYFFLQNGWLIKPQEANHTLIVNGNLFPIPDSAALFAPTSGDFQVNIQLRVSSLTQAVATGAAVQIWSAAQRDQVLADTSLSRKLASNKTTLDTNSNTLTTVDDDGTTPLVTWNTFDAQGSPSTNNIHEVDPYA